MGNGIQILAGCIGSCPSCNTVTQIWVAGGSYYPDEGGTAIDQKWFLFQPRGGLAIYGGFLGTEILLSQRTLSAPPSILSGDIQQEFRLTIIQLNPGA